MLQRVQRDPGERFLFLMPSACGPCRFGAYRNLEQLVIERLGLQERVRVWSPPWGDFFQGLPPGFAALVFAGLTALGTLQDALSHIRPAEGKPGQTERLYRGWRTRLLRHLRTKAAGDLSPARVLLEVATGRCFGIPACLGRALRSMARADTGKDLPQVLVTGEIYVRLEPFANGFLLKELNDRGLRATVDGSTEVMLYADHTAWDRGEKAGPGGHLETWIKQRIRDLCQKEATAALGLPPKPAVAELLRAASPYLRGALEGEAVLSLGVALHAWREARIDGAVLTGPMECMPNKLAEAQFTHVAEREGLATLALAMNGEPIDTTLLDSFAFDLHRRHAASATTP
jgi:predicted nucleotide-binding protein (sugar kinase/HSP70/actin superfamily)